MSRGLGRVERIILHSLWFAAGRAYDKDPPRPVTVEALAYDVRRTGEAAGRPVAPATRPTRSELESVRRALRSLRRKGLVWQIAPPRKWGYGGRWPGLAKCPPHPPWHADGLMKIIHRRQPAP